MTLAELVEAISTAAARSWICEHLTIVAKRRTMVKLRIDLIVGGFIQVYANQQTDTISFAFIQDGQRLFAVDNTDGWHCHPFHDPTLHEPLNDAMSFAEFLAEVEQAVGW